MTAPHKTAGALAARRPAETTAGAGAVAALVYAIAAHDTATAVVALLGLVPAVVTGWRELGGLDGLRRLVKTGR